MSNSIKKLNKLVNPDLKHLFHWLNAIKISLNEKKTEMVIFKSKQSKFEADLKITRIRIDTNLLFKMRKYVSLKILRSNYFAIFDCYFYYCCLVWLQNSGSIQLIVVLQNKKKENRIINFQLRNHHTSPLFKKSPILKFEDKICLENILFVSKFLNNLSPSVFNSGFVFWSGQHSYETSSSTKGILIKKHFL